METRQVKGADTGPLTLRIVTPQGVALEIACDSVSLPLADDQSGEGGGSIGVRRGHAKAALALSQGSVSAHAGGKALASTAIEAGFASIENDTVTVITSSAQLRNNAGSD